MGADISGRKVFLLNPPSVVQEELIDIVLAAEYEVYLLHDAARALNVFQRFPESVVFVNVDSPLKDEDWEQYVSQLMELGISVGVLSYNSDRALAEKYLMEIGVQCGFIALKLGLQESARTMLRVLEANEARGRRKYVRAQPPTDSRVGFNVDLPNGSVSGEILDISSVGMAVRFNSPVDLKPNSLLSDIQLKLKATLVRTDGVVLGARDDDRSVYVVLFRFRKQETKPRQQIRAFIHRSLQESIDALMR